MGYCSLDELDITLDSHKSPLEPNHEELRRYQEEFEYNLAKDELHYRVYQHDFFPNYGKKKRRRR
jgi:hypothetical protein